MSDTVEGRWSEIFGPRYLAATLILCLGVSLFAFNAFLAATALPSAVTELDGVEVISWATTLYLVFAIMGGSAAAMLKQRLGSRWALLISAGFFLAGTLLAAHGTAMNEVLVGRSVQGLGEGVVAALCFALIPELFPNRLVPKVFGMQAVVWAAAAFGGPALAGALTEFVSWRAAFLINVPLVIVFCIMVAIVVPQRREGGAASFPGIRLVAIGGGILLVALAAITSPLEAVLLLAGAVVLLVGAVLLDRRSAAPLLPDGAFWPGSAFGGGFWMVLLMPIGGATTAVYLVLLLQEMWGFGATLASAAGALMAVAWSLSAVLVANVKRRATRKILIQSGPALQAAGLLGVLAALYWTQPVLLVVAQLTIGSGFGISNGYLNLTLLESADAENRNRTATLLPTTQSAGNAVGAALAGLAANAAGLASASTPGDLRNAIVPLFVMGIGAALLALVAAQRMLAQVPDTAPEANFATE